MSLFRVALGATVLAACEAGTLMSRRTDYERAPRPAV